jgi:hypothetical protein
MELMAGEICAVQDDAPHCDRLEVGEHGGVFAPAAKAQLGPRRKPIPRPRQVDEHVIGRHLE